MDTNLKTVENTLSQDLREKLYNLTRTGKQPTQTNFFGYDIGVTGVSNAIFGFNLEEDLLEQLSNELIEKNIIPHKPKKWVGHVNLFSRGSFIPWHGDLGYVFSMTIYLNQTWNEDWGGAFIYRKTQDIDSEISCIYPKYNLGVYFNPPMAHTTSLTAINAPLRESLQIFVREF
jgi:Rps23 Pro-64 3,4-dihydroxylase Tpa1-like proline 4-hydroxylase